MVKNQPVHAGDIRDVDSIPGSEDALEGSPRQYSCLENPRDREA